MVDAVAFPKCGAPAGDTDGRHREGRRGDRAETLAQRHQHVLRHAVEHGGSRFR
ncbi:hypothetical protein [Streptomyces sp. NPDC048425]|uniref:hypothetical protein n=1 Tax=Streptomyces sp. NPDC048425 TaxID=3365548 RepID=UPI0037201ECA